MFELTRLKTIPVYAARMRLIILILLILTASACTNRERESGEIIRIGALLCQSGGCAEAGRNSKRGIEIALEEIQKSDNKKISVILEDSQETNPAKAVNAFYSLKQKGIKIFIGPSWTPAGLALAPIIKKDPTLLLISPSVGVPDFNRTANNIFSFWPYDFVASQELAKYAIKQGWHRAAIFSSLQPWEKAQGDAIAKTYQDLDGIICEHIEHLPLETDLKVESLKVVACKPEVIFFTNYFSRGFAAKEINKLGYKGAKLSVYMSEEQVKQAQGALDDAIYTSAYKPQGIFAKKYLNLYGRFRKQTPPTQLI